MVESHFGAACTGTLTWFLYNNDEQMKFKDDRWDEMPWEGYWMRCGEWWAFLPDLQGSWHPYLLLPMTSVCCRWRVGLIVKILIWILYFYSRAGFLDVDAPSSWPDSLLFLSMPPKYFRLVMQVASCFALTLYHSCIFLCIVPLP